MVGMPPDPVIDRPPVEIVPPVDVVPPLFRPSSYSLMPPALQALMREPRANDPTSREGIQARNMMHLERSRRPMEPRDKLNSNRQKAPRQVELALFPTRRTASSTCANLLMDVL
jgi:hypothetical protein